MQNCIQLDEFIMELKTAIKDVFVANVMEKEGKIQVSFLNGQKFSITVKEE